MSEQKSDSWEKDQPEHVQRTFEEIKRINKEIQKKIEPGPPPAEKPSPAQEHRTVYQEREKRKKDKDPTGTAWGVYE